MLRDYDDSDDVKEMENENRKRVRDFDCPECNANNPLENEMAAGEEVSCHYCGSSFWVKEKDGGFKLREV